jgi:hypothetical protein
VIDRRYVWITNNFLHDMATGVWAACVLVVWMLFTRRFGGHAEAASALSDTMSALFRLALAALVIIGATGGVRLGYWRRQADAEELAQKRRALLIKHAAFAALYGGGTVWLWTLIR